jgi:integrase
MKLLNIQELAPSLEHPGFWTQKRLIFLQSLLAICPKKIIRKTDLVKITSHITENMNSLFYVEGKDGKLVKYRFTKKEQEECNDVIEMLQINDWVCVFFQLKNKAERPSITPSNQEAYEILNTLNEFRTLFWKGKLDFRNNVKKALAIELLQGSGVLPEEFLSNIKDQQFLNNPKGRITLPLAAGSTREIYIPISARATLLCQWFKRNPDEYFKPDPIDWNDIKYGPIQLYLSGLEAIIYSQLQRNQLPVPLPNTDEYNPIVFRYTESAFKEANTESEIPKLIQRKRRPTQDLKHLKASQFIREKEREKAAEVLLSFKPPPHLEEEASILSDLDYPAESVEDHLPFAQECLITISQIRYQLKKLLTNKKGDYHNGTLSEEQVYPILENAVEKTLLRAEKRALLSASEVKINAIDSSIDYLKHSKTALELACVRIQYHLCERRNTLDTCFSEISSIFERGLLRYPVADLRCWDEEDIELVVCDYILERDQFELNDQTKQEILTNFKRIIRFARRHFKLFTRIELSDTNNKSNIVLTRRNHVLGPSEFDRIKVDKSPVLILAFYGGMRAGEIVSLTFNDIVLEGDEITIYIRKGKTPSAKRAIPLHLLAPPKAIKIIRDYYETRLIHYQTYKRISKRNKQPYKDKNQVYFLSSDSSCDSKLPITVMRQVLLHLKSEIGSGADLHLLRHSFASMMFLRWYCCKYPDLIKDLVDKKHWCFSKKGLAGLRTFFGEKSDITIPETNITAIIHLIKLMGHKNTDTFFQVYVHSYDAVLEHALKRIHNKTDNIGLPSNLITELVPGMRSRASQVNLKSREVKYLANFNSHN